MGISSRSRAGRRRAGLLAVAVIALGILVGACAPVEPPPPPGAPSEPPDPITATVLNRTNADRAAQGLQQLWWNARLASLAGEWAQHMSDSREFRHRDLTAAISAPGFENYAALGENILVGPEGVDGNAMHDAWMRSPSHYGVIMGNWDSMGVALAYGDGKVRAVANFGRHY